MRYSLPYAFGLQPLFYPLQATEWMRVQLISATPDAFEIGHKLKQALRLQTEHENILNEFSVSTTVRLISFCDGNDNSNACGIIAS